MSRRTGLSGLALVLLLAAIIMVPFLWTGRLPTTGAPFQSSILPTVGAGSPTPPTDITPVPTSGTPRPPTIPPATVVFPTPPTPVPNIPIISEEQAVAIVLSQNPYYAERKRRGELTVTAKLTVHGDTTAHTTSDLRFHPQLPVWMVYLHVAPWQYMGGPVGKPVLIRFNTHVYEIDAATGQVLGGGNAYMPNESGITATPEVVP